MNNLHNNAISAYEPGTGWLVLPSYIEFERGCQTVECVPEVCATELQALRRYYTLTQRGFVVRLHPDGVVLKKGANQ